jgi:hypothetical protein
LETPEGWLRRDRVLSGITRRRSTSEMAESPCISPSTSSSGAIERMIESARRILLALPESREPKFECDTSAALGVMPKRRISWAAMMVVSAISSALGSNET